MSGTQYLVKYGPAKDTCGISLMTPNRDYADGFAAGVNHRSQREHHYVEELTVIPEGTPVRFWPGSHDGRSVTSKIRKGSKVILLGGTPCQFVDNYTGGISVAHIEIIEEES